MRDPYKALGVDKKASSDEIKKAYRRLAKQYHPDRTGGDKTKEKRFKDVSAAYEILSDANRRSQFDNMASGGGIPRGVDLNDILNQMFNGQRRQQQAQSPFGGMGGGSPFGGMGGGSPFGGMGGGSPFGGMGGQSRQPQRPAPKAPPKDRKVRTASGATLILRGDDVHSDVRVSFDLAMLGHQVEVPTLTGTAKVRIPAGTCSGARLRLKNKGQARKGTESSKKGSHGDHFVTVQLDVPKVEGTESRDLLKKLLTSLNAS